MGGVIAKLVFKNGHDSLSTKHTTLWEIAAKNIDGVNIDPLGKEYGQNRVTMVVNVATN